MDAVIWNSAKDDFVDDDLKDTALLMPGMKTRHLLTFKEHAIPISLPQP